MEKFKKIYLKSVDKTEDTTEEIGKTYNAVVYTDDVDRDGEKATHDFLVELAEKLTDMPLTKNHDWSDVDSIVGRIISGQVIKDGNTECVSIILHVVDNNAIEKIDNGLYKGLSVGFEAEKENGDKGVVLLTHCTDAYEVSFVTVPAVPKASIKIKSFKLKGEKTMTFKGFKRKKAIAKFPELKSVSEEALDEIANDTDEVEVTEADIEELLKENESLREELKALGDELASYKELEEIKKSESLILDETEKAVDELEPTPEAKECIMDEAKECIEKGDLIVEHLSEDECAEEHIADEHVNGLDEFIAKTKAKYTKLKMLGYKPETKEVEKTTEKIVKTAQKNSVGFSVNKVTTKSKEQKLTNSSVRFE